MLGHRRLGRGTCRQCTPPCVTLPTNPAPSYDSVRGYTNGTLHFGDRDGFDTRTDGTAKKDERGSTLHFGDRDGLKKDGTTRKDGTAKKDERGSTLHVGDRDGLRKDGTAKKDERGSTLPFGARDGLRTTLHFGITDGLIRKRKGTHLRTSSDQREEKERVDQTSDPPGPDNQPKRPCGTPWRTRPLTTVMSGTDG